MTPDTTIVLNANDHPEGTRLLFADGRPYESTVAEWSPSCKFVRMMHSGDYDNDGNWQYANSVHPVEVLPPAPEREREPDEDRPF